uniref:FAD/NAD(P)-binding domain-containing protein n=1 Tax=Pinguiococcus pyrenoidosus TaxID=172671 RepID=A0A7R9UDT3_9STRA|mmetsp:Transcript_6989/g.26902  ORF Transcript_6989/g.26902 Transcript_6989/m.26902 type:complete len:612 (+) Transcript_6989:131-1966(+)
MGVKGRALRLLAAALAVCQVAGFLASSKKLPSTRRPLRLYSTSEDLLREKLSKENEREVSDAAELQKLAESAREAEEAGYNNILGERPYLQVLVERGLEQVDEAAEKVRSTVVDFLEDAESKAAKPGPKPKAERPKVVVLGTGWASHSLLKGIDAQKKFNVVVISPRNYFLFTPMLAGAAVGTVEDRSITEPIRRVNKNADYLEATVTAINPDSKSVTCQSIVCEGTACDIEEFDVEYDKLVIGVGATTNTFGIPGVKEHCMFLKQVDDARRIRSAIGNVFERANIPSLTDEQREQALTFVTIGAGPTGVEFTSELRDFLAQDAPKYYPHLLKSVRVILIEATNRILGAFDEDMANAAMASLERGTDKRVPTEVILGVGVKEVKQREILLSDGRTVPYGLSIWAAGNGPLPLVLETINKIPVQKDMQEQNLVPRGGRGRLLVDGWLRVKGAPDVFAVGDCSIMDTQPLPATAQVASQQATFLARLLSGDYDTTAKIPTAVGSDIRSSDRFMPAQQRDSGKGAADAAAALEPPQRFAKPFQFLNLGILAYVGNDKGIAQLQVNKTPVKSKGFGGWLLWRSIYLSKQVSWRNRALVAIDWMKTTLFGRDLTRL